MNFIEYCIATKNYSTLKAIKDYSEVRTFATSKSDKGLSKKQKAALIAAGAGGAGLTAATAAYLKDGEVGRKVRELTGNDTVMDKLNDAKDVVDDSAWGGRGLRNVLGKETFRDQVLNAKDKVTEALEPESKLDKGLRWLRTKTGNATPSDKLRNMKDKFTDDDDDDDDIDD